MLKNTALLLKYSWENAYREKYFWLFVGVISFGAIVANLFIHSNNHWVSFLGLVNQFLYLLLLLISYTGIIYITYRKTIRGSLKLADIFQVVKKSFKKSIALFLVFSTLFVPFLCMAIYLSWNQSGQATSFSRTVYSFAMFSSVFNFIWCFPLTEIVIYDSNVQESIRKAWKIIVNHLIFLLLLGGMLALVSQIIGILFGALAVLGKFNFDFSALRNLDLISPHLSFADNRFYWFLSAVCQSIWACYSIMVLVLTYLKYSDVKIQSKFP